MMNMVQDVYQMNIGMKIQHVFIKMKHIIEMERHIVCVIDLVNKPHGSWNIPAI